MASRCTCTINFSYQGVHHVTTPNQLLTSSFFLRPCPRDVPDNGASVESGKFLRSFYFSLTPPKDFLVVPKNQFVRVNIVRHIPPLHSSDTSLLDPPPRFPLSFFLGHSIFFGDWKSQIEERGRGEEEEEDGEQLGKAGRRQAG